MCVALALVGQKRFRHKPPASERLDVRSIRQPRKCRQPVLQRRRDSRPPVMARYLLDGDRLPAVVPLRQGHEQEIGQGLPSRCTQSRQAMELRQQLDAGQLVVEPAHVGGRSLVTDRVTPLVPRHPGRAGRRLVREIVRVLRHPECDLLREQLQAQSIEYAGAGEQFTPIFDDGSPTRVVGREKGCVVQSARGFIRQLVGKHSDAVAVPVRPTGSERGGAHRAPPAMSGDRKATDEGQQSIRLIVSQQPQRPCEDLRAVVGFWAAVGNRQRGQGRNDDVAEDVLSSKPAREPAVEELLDGRVAALRTLLRANVRMEEGDMGSERSGHVSDQIHGIIRATYRLEEQRGGVTCRDRAPVLCRQEPRVDQWIQCANSRFGTQICGQNREEADQEVVPRYVDYLGTDMRRHPFDGRPPLGSGRLRRTGMSRRLLI